MKKLILTIAILIIGLSTFAQTPTSFQYQAVLRDATGQVLANQQVEIGIAILQGSASGTEVFSENHSVTTNNFGLANLQIGSVNPAGMETIDWSAGPYFIQISVDGTIMGTSQLLSVPYALHAKVAETVTGGITETDPVYSGSEAANITATDITNLSNLSGTNTGDQDLSTLASKIALGDSTAQVRSEIPDVSGFLTSETDPLFTNWDRSTGISITESQISDLDHFTGDDISGNETAFDGWDKDVSDDFTTADETDPVFSSSLAAAITAADTARWASNNYTQNELQNLKLENQQLSISGGNTIDLSEAYYIADSSATNELQDISLNGTQLSISKGSSVDLASLQDGTGTDNQTISLDGNQLVISNGNRIYLPYIRTEGDSNPHNEIQTLSIANDTIFLSREGGKVKLPAETDPAFTNWDKSTGIKITESQITDLDHFTNSDEIDPVYAADSTALKNAIAKNKTAIVDTAFLLRTDLASKLALADTATLLNSETAQNKQAIIDTAANIRADMFTTEIDPVFTAWDKSTGIEITESQITDLKHFTGDSINGNETAFDGWDKDASDDFDGQYSSLSGTPQNVSAFTNDAGYISSPNDADADPANELQVLSISNDTIYLSDGGKVKLPAGNAMSLDAAYDNGRTITADAGAFEINGNSGVLFTGTFGSSDTPPASGAGTRMMWYPAKAAFRAGGVNSTQWDSPNIGNYSVALGYYNLASGDRSTALGQETKAQGNSSTAMGYRAIAGELASTAMGHTTTASGYASSALGYKTTASGKHSTATGQETTASGINSTAMGDSTDAIGFASTAMGYKTTASGDASTAMGKETKAEGNSSTAMGYRTTAKVASTAMGHTTIASGYASTAMGHTTIASGYASTAMGYRTTASGAASTAMGYGTVAKGESSTAIGSYNWALENAIFEIGIGEHGARNNALTVLQNGYVGIGTTSPDYPLEVSGSGWYRENQTIAYFQLPSNIWESYYGQATTKSWDYSIVASSYIKVGGLHVFSDRRIKTNIQPNSCQTDLDLVNKMEVVNYQYIDKVEKGNITKKGFIAQQIEEVLPDAVGKSKAFIPDIYKKASRVVADSTANTLTISTPVAHNLKEGNLLRFITLGGTHEKEVLSVLSDNTFTVEKPEGDCSQVFVYGKKVDDFRAIDYDQVFSAGIGAIQELSRQNDELKQTIENLQNENSSLHAENSDIKQRLETLEALVKNTLNGLATEKASAQK